MIPPMRKSGWSFGNKSKSGAARPAPGEVGTFTQDPDPNVCCRSGHEGKR